ncbi:hypothetical protein CJD36_005970 [Flavipsychrobacter stenotrophus]|uniref:LTD domain-containing protein n=1 Tax=Flavipsychrobacter stenotrophus TaxID=2077091 RepID=A0A2S7SXT8_9BACT|nr:FG-GAP-like repeat-containing protein [Flavipsychrobacter stenotrophus]PQJ11346.1 hypothetical protein CJD36_005970 [Flavipsychrobacter stenotrophus]
MRHSLQSTAFRSTVLTLTLLVSMLFSRTANGQTSTLVISQVYGGGGATGATYLNDFVELFNPTTSTITITNWSIQYAATTGTSWGVTTIPSAVIAPGKYYLIQLASGGAVGSSLPTPDLTGSTNMSATVGKVALCSNTTALTVANPSGGALVDLVGFGTGTNGFEGAGPTATLSASLAAIRASAGCTDNNSNNTDFTTGTPSARNSSSSANICGVTNYYWSGSGTLSSTANWGVNTNGTGTAPTNFTNSGQTFNIRNGGTPTLTANWTVTGGGSKIVVENNDLTIPSGFSIIGKIDVNSGRTLTISNATTPTLGTLNASSTVIYNNGTANTLNFITTYGNIIFDGAATTITAPPVYNNMRFAGSITLTNSASFNAPLANLIPVSSSAQTLTGNSGSFTIDSFISVAGTKTGTLTLASGTTMTLAGSLKMDNTGSPNVFNDGGNTINVKGYVITAGNAAGYSLSGTINVVPTAAMLFMGSATTLGGVAALPNVTLGTSASLSSFVGTSTVAGNLSIASGYTSTLTLGNLSIGGNYTWSPTATKVASGANVTFNGTAQTFSTAVAAGHVFSTTTIAASTGLTAVTKYNTGDFTWNSGSLTVAPGTTTAVGTTFSVTGVFSGSSAKTLLGRGTIGDVPTTTNLNGGLLKLTGTSTATNGITVGSATTPFNSAVLDLTSAGAWNDVASNSISINPYSQLYMTVAPTTATNFPISLKGIGNNISTTYGLGALKTAAIITLANPVTIAADATINASAALTLSGPITFTGQLTKRGAGLMTIAGSSTSISGAGGFKLSEGAATVLSGSSLGSGPLEIAEASTTTLTLTLNNTQTVSELSSSWTKVSGNQVNVLNLASGSALTITQTSNTTFGDRTGVTSLKNTITGPGNLTKLGSGALTLTSGAHAHTGSLTVGAGTFTLAPSLTGSTFADGGVTVSGGALVVTPAALTTLGYTGGIVASSGSMTVVNSVSLTLGSLTVSGANVTLTNGATLQQNASGSPVAISSGSLTINGSVAASLGLGGISASGGTFRVANTAGVVTLGSMNISGTSVTLANAAAVTQGTSGTLTMSSGSLNITGAATVTLGAGGITLSGGVLNISPSAPPATLTFTGATVTLSAPTYLSGGAISTGGIGGTTIINCGTVTLTSNSTITLGTGAAHSIKFGTSATGWTGGALLTIRGWQGSFQSGTAVSTKGKVFFGTAAGLGANLAQIKFDDGTYVYDALQLSTGEVVPKAFITTNAPSPAGPYYNDNPIALTVGYTYTGPTLPAGTVYTVEVSDIAGSYVSPIASASSTVSPIAVTIPSLTPVGTYKIRISSSSPLAITGTEQSLVLVGHPPIITALSAYAGVAPGQTISITGSNFNIVPSFNKVSFGATGVNADTTSTISTLIVTVPVGATADLVTVNDITTHLSANSPKVFVPDYKNEYFTTAQTFQTPVTYATDSSTNFGFTPWNSAVGDLDGDGDLDLVVLTGKLSPATSYIATYENIGTNGGSADFSTSTFRRVSFRASSAIGTSVKIADMDDDGKPDVIVSSINSAAINVFRNVTTGYSTTLHGAITYDTRTDVSYNPRAANAQKITIADFDKDGRPDIAGGCFGSSGTGTNESRLVVIRNKTTSGVSFGTASAFFDTVTYTSNNNTGATGSSACSGDFTGDGKIDIAMIDQNRTGAGTVSIFKNTCPSVGTISFTLQSGPLTTGIGAADIATADFNGDGSLDLVVSNQLSSTIDVYLNTNDTTAPFVATPSYSMTGLTYAGPSGTVSLAPAGLAVADMNGDGKVDVIAVSSNNAIGGATSDTMLIYTNTTTLVGTPAFSAPFILHTGGSAASAGVIVADLDKDKYPDLIVANISDNTISIIRNKPTLNIGSITGVPTPLCYLATTTLSYSTASIGSPYTGSPLPTDLSGQWTSTDPSLATINSSTGVVQGLAFGTPTISYQITVTGTNLSGSASNTLTVNKVDISPDAAPALCIGATTLPIGYSAVDGTPTNYSVAYDATALAAGFLDVSNAVLSGGTITLVVPGTAVAGQTYHSSITVSDASCTSTPAYDVAFNSYDPPTASIGASTATPCNNHYAEILFTGTIDASFNYSVDGITASPEVLTGGAFTLALPHVTASHAYVLIDVQDVHCTTTYNTTQNVSPISMNWVGGVTSHTTEWNQANNWTCLEVPGDTDIVHISNITPRPEVLADSIANALDITLLSGATLTLNTASVLNVKGNVSNNGIVIGAGTMIMNGTSAQTIDGIGFVDRLTIDNSAGATINTGARATVKSLLTVNAGDLATNDSLALFSDANGSARIGEIPGAGASITGKVKVYQYIPAGYRRFRFWAHPFSDTLSLSQLQFYMDITGSGGAGNGFTTTTTNAPSAFRLDPFTENSSLGYDPGWKPITKINGTAADSNKLKPGQGLRLFMRGAKGEGLIGFPYIIHENTVAMIGNVNQGTKVITLNRGAGPDPTLMDFNMVGNPFASPVNIGAALWNASDLNMSGTGDITGAAAYVWNASLGVAGQFQPVDIDGSNYFLQANACFQVRAAGNNKHITFTESMKSDTVTTPLFKQSSSEHLTLNIYDANYHMWDMWKLRFNSAANDAEDAKYDAVKPSGADFNFYSMSADNKKMVIDARPFVKDATIPLGISSPYKQDFIIRADDMKLAEGTAVFLHDKMLKKYVELQAGTEYRFTVSNDKSSQGNDRFEIAMKPAQVVATGFKVTMAPNPTSDDVKISFTSNKKDNVSIRVMDMSGVTVYTQDLGAVQNGNTVVSLGKFASGIYMIELTSGTEHSIQKLVKE